eukprot:g2139.t1
MKVRRNDFVNGCMAFFWTTVIIVAKTEVAAVTTTSAYLGYFLRNMNQSASGNLTPLSPCESTSSSPLPDFLDGYKHYRLLPGDFSYGKYHFDGLATVMKLEFAASASSSSISYLTKAYESQAYVDKEDHKCVFFGNGIGPEIKTLVPKDGVCFQNPGVNLLPIQNELWLTIDTSSWGRVDPDTLDTVANAKPEVNSFVLNAHPACDRNQDVCYVQHPCPTKASPESDQVCISTLNASEGLANLGVEIVSRVTMPKKKIIQHSHSPCITPNYVISKLDSFVLRDPLFNKNGGLLKYAHQGEDDLWMVMDRRTNASRLLRSESHAFVNNHFWNCAEDPKSGNVIVETVAATKNYLDNYFDYNLEKPVPVWSDLFHPPLRCEVPAGGESAITCVPLLAANASIEYFDYPTFNPEYKMNPDYRYFYAIAPGQTSTSRWFDTVTKIDRSTYTVTASWTDDNLYMTEADFIPRPNGSAEDDGVLVTIAYNATSDESLLAVLDAKDLSVLAIAPFGFAVPFHAHGISCAKDRACWTNP